MTFTDIRGILEESTGTLCEPPIIIEEAPFTYPIKKEAAGVYIKFNLETEKAIPNDFETRVFRADGVLRHLLLRTK